MILSKSNLKKVTDQLSYQVKYQALEQIIIQVYDKVKNQVYYNVPDQVLDQIKIQVYDRVYYQVHDQTNN